MARAIIAGVSSDTAGSSQSPRGSRHSPFSSNLPTTPFFLDDQDFLETFGELPHALGFQRPGHRHLVDAQADLGGVGLGDAEIVERLADVEVTLAAGDDSQPRSRRVDDDAVQAIGARVVQDRVDLAVVHPGLGGQERIRPAQRHAVPGEGKIAGNHDLGARRVDLHRRRALDGVGDALEAHPAARVAAHRPAVEAEVEDLLHRRRIEHRDHRRGEHVVGLVRQRRRLRAVIVAGQHQHAAVLRRAGVVRVLEHVAAAVHARALAVPHREHAVVARALVEVDLLRAPDRRRSEVFVQARLEADVRGVEEFLRAPQRLVEGAQRRAAIAGDEAGGVESRQDVALPLQQQQAHQRLRAVQEDAARLDGVFVVKCKFAQWGKGGSHRRFTPQEVEFPGWGSARPGSACRGEKRVCRAAPTCNSSCRAATARSTARTARAPCRR
jgi:hypothetical protein